LSVDKEWELGNYGDLKVWERAHFLTLAIYKATAMFPREEVYGLTRQLRGASASIPANIAEGCGRESDAELVRFLRIALGSANELDYHLLLAHDLTLLSRGDHEKLSSDTAEIRRMLASLIRKLQAKA
jgi:four helix bundle protein